jgi:hypothetical protein
MIHWYRNNFRPLEVSKVNGSGGFFVDQNECLPELCLDPEVWALDYRNYKPIKGVDHFGGAFPNLKFLHLVRYNKLDLCDFKNHSLLKKVELYYSPKLVDISCVFEHDVEFLGLEKCKNVNIVGLKSNTLRELRVFGGEFASLDFLVNFPKLTRISLVDVKVEDGDFFSLKELPKLSDVCFTQRKGANCTEDELNAIIQSRGFYQQKIVDLPGGYQTFDAIYL